MRQKWGRFLIYVILCYWVLGYGNVIVAGLGYQRLMNQDGDKTQSPSNRVKIQVVQEGGEEPCIVRYHFSLYYSPRYIRRLCFWILAISPFLALGMMVALFKGPNSRFRGLCYLILFVAASLLPVLVINNFRSVSVTVMVGAGFLGALFWWIDITFTEFEGFKQSLNSIAKMKDSRVERIDILFQSRKMTFFMIYALFTLATISLGLAVSQIYVKHYEVQSVCSLHIGYFVALILLGSVGLLGGVAAELGHQIHEIIKVLGKNK